MHEFTPCFAAGTSEKAASRDDYCFTNVLLRQVAGWAAAGYRGCCYKLRSFYGLVFVCWPLREAELREIWARLAADEFRKN